jgi:hypothetical protein
MGMVAVNLAATHIDRQQNQRQIVKTVLQLSSVAVLAPIGMATASPVAA